MKKILLISIALLILTMVFTGCADTSQEDAENGSVTDEQEAEMVFTVQYIKDSGYLDSREYPFAALINSVDELEAYVASDKEDYSSGLDGDGCADFYLAAEGYGEEFFADSSLLIVLLSEGSGSVTHEVTDVTIGDYAIVVDVSRIVPAVGTSDMAQWYILIEMPNEGIGSQDVELNITE